MLDDQHNLWTNVFIDVYVFSLKDAEWTWTKTLREQHLKKDIWRLIENLPTSSESPWHKDKWMPSKETWRIQNCAISGCTEPFGETPNWNTEPNTERECSLHPILLAHQSKFGAHCTLEVQGSSEMVGIRLVWCTPAAHRIFDEEQRICQNNNGYLTWKSTEPGLVYTLGVPDWPGVTQKSLLPSNGSFGLGLYIYHWTGHLKMWRAEKLNVCWDTFSISQNT